jgi:hypothetical protein
VINQHIVQTYYFLFIVSIRNIDTVAVASA